MDQSILDFINSQRVGVIAVEMLDGAPHAATVHFAHTEDPLTLYFETYRNTRKAEALFGREISRASFVIGAFDGTKQTLQLDGEVQLLKPDEKDLFNKVYLEKFPGKKAKAKDPIFVMFKFTPKWWRFTDWSNSEQKVILTSK